MTEEFTAKYREDMAQLNALPPTLEPHATHNIEPMIALTRTLIEKGHAYESQGHVLFAVESMPDYGKLSRRSLDDMLAGARVEVADYKRHPGGFRPVETGGGRRSRLGQPLGARPAGLAPGVFGHDPGAPR